LFVTVEQIKEVLGKDSLVRKYAEDLHKKKSLLIMGRGYNYATCLEGALVSNNLNVKILFFPIAILAMKSQFA
jgi:hypothetical protein